MNDCLSYQKYCWDSYKQEVNIPKDYCYLNGNPVKVHVPVDTAVGGLMIIGAYPTAHFNVIGGVRDVPVGDHLYPFSNEKHFDGSRVRGVDSGRELEDLFLKPLEVNRDSTWITDLVKVFLFKEGHQLKYKSLGFRGNLVDRNQFDNIAKEGLSFMYKEIEICQPKVILGLGVEVNAILLNESKSVATKTIAAVERRELNGYTYFACPHPGILMREKSEPKTWRTVLTEIIEQVKPMLIIQA